MSLKGDSNACWENVDSLAHAGYTVRDYPEKYPDFRASYHMVAGSGEGYTYPLSVIGYWSLLSEDLRIQSSGRAYLKSWSTQEVYLGNLHGSVYMELWVDGVAVGHISVLPKKRLDIAGDMWHVLNNPALESPKGVLSEADDTLLIVPAVNYNSDANEGVWEKLRFSHASEVFLDPENYDEYPWKWEGYEPTELATMAVFPLGTSKGYIDRYDGSPIGTVAGRSESIVKAILKMLP